MRTITIQIGKIIASWFIESYVTIFCPLQFKIEMKHILSMKKATWTQEQIRAIFAKTETRLLGGKKYNGKCRNVQQRLW